MRETPDSERTLLVGGFDPTDMETVRITSCSATEIVAGRELRGEDTGKGALLEQTFAEAKGLSVGDAIELAGRSFAVVGILSPGTRPARADVYLAISDAEEVIESRLTAPLNGRVNGVLVGGRDARRQSNLIVDVEKILGPQGATGGYGCFSPAGQATEQGEQGTTLLALLLSIGIGLTVARMQYAYVTDRRREIAILKAIGWSQRQVGRQAVLETMIPWAMGGALGALAAGLMAILNGTTASLPKALGVSLAIVGIIAGCAAWLAARSAQRVYPAQVLRKG
jgi:lipoprotein-releasing system permease protein